ncbi:alpha/beta fold hydrolase [Aquimarina hainanensis]|uniref:Alpha/beta fold hydrolase n=1 Tax=Aquimarina hainanensis TaxID=1578017 RepID=A0ABW5N4Q7_9FLAO|nr:alpha/beta hydrolase [Aquimarina sp. TRL1]QKX06101.1 alpha/beta hydrolase [Aquimarina sp. TRL1]
MKKIIIYTLKTIVLIGLLMSSYACSKGDDNINDLSETIYVRHKQADMPAYIHGNASEKVFLIILHGGPGGTGWGERKNTVKSKIEKNNAVVYFDQRGSGNSQGSYSENDVSVDLMAEDVLALVKVLKAKYGNDARFFLMGHSWGGTLGPATLLKDQSDFMGWIDVDGSHDPKGSYNTYKIALTQMADTQIALGNSVSYWKDVKNLVQNVGANYSDDDFYKLNRETHNGEQKLVDDKIINKLQNDGIEGVQYNLFTTLWNGSKIQSILVKKGLFSKVSFTNRLDEITIPSLVLWGKHDLIVPAVYAQEAYDLLGSDQKELFIFEKSGHSPMDSEPDLFAEKVINFINRHK